MKATTTNGALCARWASNEKYITGSGTEKFDQWAYAIPYTMRNPLYHPRHEYFRRILCNVIGQDVVNGQLPWDEAWLGRIVSDICYHNAKTYFNFTHQSAQ